MLRNRDYRGTDRNCALPATAAKQSHLPLIFLLLLFVGTSCQNLSAQQAGRAEATAATETSKSGVEEELRAMREEIRALRQEVHDLREEVRTKLPSHDISSVAAVSDRRTYARRSEIDATTARRSEVDAHAINPAPAQDAASSASQTSTETQPSEIASTVSMLQSQVAEQAQTKVESNSKMPVKVFGTILSTTFFNSRAVDWADDDE